MTVVSPPPRHERTLRTIFRGILIVGTVAAFAGFGTSVGASGILPGQNPSANLAPSPDFTSSGTCTSVGDAWQCANPCVSAQLTFPVFTNSSSCAGYVLQALDAARRAEKVAPMVLPSNWSRLTAPEQLFVLADLERVARGLPPYLGLNRALDREAQRAARLDEDPTLAAGFAAGTDASGVYGLGGAWSTGFSTLVADYFWMYSDGWGGSRATTSNLACTSAGAPGCWAHRDELLGYDPRFNPGVGLGCRTCEMGAGFAIVGGHASLTDLVELPAGKPPAMTFTWARNVLPFLRTVRHAAAAPLRLRTTLRQATWTPWSPTPTSCLHGHVSPFGGACRHVLHPSGQVARSTEWEE